MCKYINQNLTRVDFDKSEKRSSFPFARILFGNDVLVIEPQEFVLMQGLVLKDDQELEKELNVGSQRIVVGLVWTSL